MNARRVVTAALLMVLVVAPVAAAVVFQDGGYHVIDYRVDRVEARNGFFGNPTTVELVNGGDIDRLSVYGVSRGIVSGGAMRESIYAHNDSQIIMTGGNIVGVVKGYENSTIAISGGEIGSSVYISNRAQISGGLIKGTLQLLLEGQSQFSGGEIEGRIEATDSTVLHISGGTVRDGLRCQEFSQTAISGGSIDGSIPIIQNANLTVWGHSFVIDGTPVPYGSYDRGGETTRYGYLTGVLANGDLASHNFSLSDNATITLVPEPTSLLLLALGGIALLRRKRGYGG